MSSKVKRSIFEKWIVICCVICSEWESLDWNKHRTIKPIFRGFSNEVITGKQHVDSIASTEVHLTLSHLFDTPFKAPLSSITSLIICSNFLYTVQYSCIRLYSTPKCSTALFSRLSLSLAHDTSCTLPKGKGQKNVTLCQSTTLKRLTWRQSLTEQTLFEKVNTFTNASALNICHGAWRLIKKNKPKPALATFC